MIKAGGGIICLYVSMTCIEIGRGGLFQKISRTLHSTFMLST